MIKNGIEIINDSVKCSSCEKEGHQLESVLVKTKAGYRNLQYCICCGSPSIWRKLDCMDDQRSALYSSSPCLAMKCL
jgi:hypothetical protein